MAADALVLNRSFRAVQTTSWQRALTLVFLDHALVVDQEYRTYGFEDWKQLSEAMAHHPAGFVHTTDFRIAIPEVIALKVFDHVPETEVTFSRRNIYEHYKHRCCYCGRHFPTSELNLDHVVPRSRGGRTGWDNIVTSCIPCNLKKGGRRPEEAGMRLLIHPTRPKRRSLTLALRVPMRMRASWQRFLDRIYWDSALEP